MSSEAGEVQTSASAYGLGSDRVRENPQSATCQRERGVRGTASGNLYEEDETILRLLDMVGAKLEENPGLEGSALVSQAEPDAKPPLNGEPVLNIRIRNPRHKVTVPFDERSKGFVWFFSFFAYFSELERQHPAPT